MEIKEKKKTLELPSDEPKWLFEKRLSALVSYEKESLPERVSHLWKYSDPSWFEFNPDSGCVISSEKLKLVFNLDTDIKNTGIVLMELKDAFRNEKYKDLISKHFGRLTAKYSGRLSYFNESFWSNGFFLYVPKNVKIEKPLTVKLLPGELNNFAVVRNLILLEECSSVNLIDESSSSEAANLLVNVVTEIFLEKESRLSYANLQLHSKQTTSHLFQRAEINTNAELTNVIIALGGKISKADLGTNLCGEHASVTTYGIVLGDGIQKFDHHTTLEHNASYTKSDLNFRVALKDKSRSAYTGNLKIAHEAVKSDAHQENRNLLLSGEAKAESIPELEILTNDVVKCNHGVTVGQVDKDQIFYLMSRGLSRKEAEQTIVEGFMEPTISKIPEESLREEILSKIKNKLETL